MKNDIIVQWLGGWAGEANFASAAFRLFLALFFASVLGFERASKRHSAGLRTFILITLTSAAAAFMDSVINENNADFIPLLSAASVFCAIAISVKSVLFSAKNQIKGLTTSAGLIASAFFGLCIGVGFYTLALMIFAVLLIVLAWFPKIEIYLKNRSNHFEIHLELADKGSLQNFVTTIRKLGMRIDDIEINNAYAGSGLSVYSITLTIISAELKKYKTHREIIEALSTLEYVRHIEEMN
ncbi:MAG: MgtC/SapB family protein [Clostridia bacterium]|nr:MgtC/SapB family protein [Clostridiales bacterium]MDD7166224.1 MgtC/SapB family protein [Clostridia bacterium]MDY2900633.1 MgtC/SapB family protein [Christensenellaceae bacterium]